MRTIIRELLFALIAAPFSSASVSSFQSDSFLVYVNTVNSLTSLEVSPPPFHHIRFWPLSSCSPATFFEFLDLTFSHPSIVLLDSGMG